MPDAGVAHSEAQRGRGLHAALGLVAVLIACAAVYWPRLGVNGLSMTEGHRVLPAWEILDRKEWLSPRLFGHAYLRKPPGMSWAVAASSMVLGRTEFAARAVSAVCATAMALVAFGFAARWYGPRWGAAAGVACALTPLFWESGRSAEIEALNNLGTHLVMLGILDLLVFQAGRKDRERWFSIPLLASVGMVIAGISKGPASLACLVGVVTAACAVRKSFWTLLSPALWAALLAAGLTLGGLAWLIWRSVADEPVVFQDPADFLWPRGRLVEIATLAPEALVLGLPMSFALLCPWGRLASRDAERSPEERDGLTMARAAAFACLFSLTVFVAIGTYNPRYAMPAFTVVPLIVPHVVRSALRSLDSRRRSVTVLLMLGHPVAWPIVLLAGGIGFGVYQENQRATSSGRDAGVALAARLPHRAIVWCDGLIEARPEVMHYAFRAALDEQRWITFRWAPGLAWEPRLPAEGEFLILRTDAGLDERAAYVRSGLIPRLTSVATGRVHKFEFEVFRETE